MPQKFGGCGTQLSLIIELSLSFTRLQLKAHLSVNSGTTQDCRQGSLMWLCAHLSTYVAKSAPALTPSTRTRPLAPGKQTHG